MKAAMSDYPPGWDQERVDRVLRQYESQTDKAAAAEDEAAGDRIEPVPVTPVRKLRGFLKGIDTDVTREDDRV